MLVVVMENISASTRICTWWVVATVFCFHWYWCLFHCAVVARWSFSCGKSAKNRKLFPDPRSITRCVRFPHPFTMCLTLFFFQSHFSFASQNMLIKEIVIGAVDWKIVTDALAFVCCCWISSLRGKMVGQFVCFQQVFQLAGVCVGNVMSLKSPWAALLLMYPLQFPLSWWRSSFVNDVTFGCPTSDSTQAFKKAIIKFMGGSQLQHNCLAFCSPPLLCFWTVLTSFLLMFSSPSLSHSLYLAQFSFFPERETWSTYKYEPRGNFYCKYFKHFFARVKLPVFYTPNKSLRDVCYSTCSSPLSKLSDSFMCLYCETLWNPSGLKTLM